MKKIETLAREEKLYTEKDVETMRMARLKARHKIHDIRDGMKSDPAQNAKWEADNKQVDTILHELVSQGTYKEIVISKEEARRRTSGRTVWVKRPITKDELCLRLFPVNFVGRGRTIEMLMNDVSYLIDDEHTMKGVRLAIKEAYELGQEDLTNMLRENLNDKPAGRKPSAPDPIYWGRKLNDYRIGHKEYKKNPKSRIAARFALNQVKNDWLKAYPENPVTGEQSNPPVSEDTFIAYEKIYLKSIKQTE